MKRLAKPAALVGTISAAILIGAFILAPQGADALKRIRGYWVFEKLNVNTAGNLLYAGTAITSTAAEMNKLDGVTATTAELNFVDVTAGTLTASKALVADSSSQLDVVDVTGSVKLSGEVAMKVTTADITSAQLLALNATPITLVAAPGAGKAILVDHVCIQLDWNSAAYDGIAAGEDLQITYTDGSGQAATADIETTGFLDSTADAVRCVWPDATLDTIGDKTPVANAAIVLSLLTAEIATGDSPLDVQIWYSELTTEIP
ncbi:MAG: hypothetical protein ACE5FA_04740 [Dehalococcoidia bacterium]